MKKLNRIGLEIGKTKELGELLNDLLANYSVFYQNARGYHWNIKEDKFLELHIKFEELYNNLFVKIDDIAERILTLGHLPKHKYTDYLKLTQIYETNQVSDGYTSIEQILEAYKILLVKQRRILILSSKIGDEGTNAQMSENIREQEKLVWMYASFLNNKYK